MARFWKFLFRLSGWSLDITVAKREKCVICVAPHTSNWDFLMGLMAYRSLGRKANFLMKKFWFFFPLKYLLSRLGGIPVVRNNKKNSLTSQIIEMFRNRSYINLAVTPEGTRKAVDKWKTGFLYIAYGAKVPIQLAVIDYFNKKILIKEEYIPTNDPESDLKSIKAYYSNFKNAAKYPEKFKV